MDDDGMEGFPVFLCERCTHTQLPHASNQLHSTANTGALTHTHRHFTLLHTQMPEY